MMNQNWRNRGTPLTYKRDLQKEFTRKYDRDRFKDANESSIRTTYVDDQHSPIIHVQSVQFHADRDGKSHHTSEFELMQSDWPVPVYRRGQPFEMTVRFNREYIPGEDTVHLLALYGPTPSVRDGTKCKIVLSEKSSGTDTYWEVLTKTARGAELTIQVQTPITCQVGMWRLSLVTYKSRSIGSLQYDLPQDLFILFNPWKKNDAVFMVDDREREEYIMNDHGQIFMGTDKESYGYPWLFSQFDLVILPALTLLMEQSDVPHWARGNPVMVARALSAVINSYDDNGLLEGKWEGSFEDGTEPTSWTGSKGFYEEYLKTGQSVKYGQCWVFAGALTTACRALGIPCRPVTCFVCAHDTNESLTVDKFFTKDMKLVEGGDDGDGYDSFWNFHVWNDVWMTRPDLPPGYDGWQVLDATPQELSNQKYRTGPMSVKAIKEGNIGLPYDGAFVFAEVNADLCHFQEDDNSPWGYTRFMLDPHHVGKQILTQSLTTNEYGENGKEDIIHLYKHKEGTEAERASVFNALRGHLKAQKYYKAVPTTVQRDVFFKLKEIDAISIGDEFTMVLVVENHSSSQRSIKANLRADAALYTGKILGPIKQSDVKMSLGPKEAQTVKVVVTPDEYKGVTGTNIQFKITAVASVLDTKQFFTAEDNFDILKNKLEIMVLGHMKINSISEVSFSFVNPYAKPLTNCELLIEGPSLQRPKTVKLRDVRPNGHIQHIESLVPKKQGSSILVTTFKSDQLSVIKGSKNITIY